MWSFHRLPSGQWSEDGSLLTYPGESSIKLSRRQRTVIPCWPSAAGHPRKKETWPVAKWWWSAAEKTLLPSRAAAAAAKRRKRNPGESCCQEGEEKRCCCLSFSSSSSPHVPGIKLNGMGAKSENDVFFPFFFLAGAWKNYLLPICVRMRMTEFSTHSWGSHFLLPLACWRASIVIIVRQELIYRHPSCHNCLGLI